MFIEIAIIIFIIIICLCITMIHGSRESILEIEYQRYYSTHSIVKSINDSLVTGSRYELNNIIERFLLNRANNTESIDVLLNEIKIKDITLKTDIRLLIDYVKPKEEKIGKLHVVKNKNFVTFKYKLFNGIVYRNRYIILSDLANDTMISRMLMCYSSVLPGSQHWQNPSYIYKRYIKEFDIYVEGFASPLNSQLLKIRKFDMPFLQKNKRTLATKPNCFCSVFYDTDKYFGSLGSFFDFDFSNVNAFCGTPYVPQLLDRIIDKIMATEINGIVILGLPHWIDSEWYMKIVKHPQFALEHVYYRNTYYFENYQKNDQRITAKFNTLVVVLSKKIINREFFNNLYKL